MAKLTPVLPELLGMDVQHGDNHALGPLSYRQSYLARPEVTSRRSTAVLSHTYIVTL